MERWGCGEKEGRNEKNESENVKEGEWKWMERDGQETGTCWENGKIRESKRKELRKVEKLRSTDEKERKEIGMVKREWVI